MRNAPSLLSVLFLCGSALAQSTWYVDAHATGPGDGSPAHPYATIGAAIASAGIGDTILVAPGTYPENLGYQVGNLNLIASAGPSSTIIEGHVAGPMLLEGFTLLNEDPVELVGGTLRRCILRNPTPLSPYSRGVLFSDSSVIENCVFTGFQTAFMMFLYSSWPSQFRNTVAFGNGTLISPGSCADFDSCCLPRLPMGFRISQTNTVLGDPGFWDPARMDFHLAPGSACIDAGVGLDPDGTPADIGALPFDAGYAPGPAVYCSASQTSDGCFASISGSGVCSLSGSTPFWITALDVTPNRLGRLLYSFGEANTPFEGGILCLAAPLRRTPPSNSGSAGQGPCAGILSYDFHARVQSGVDPALVPGRIVYAQYRFRDPFSPGGYGVAFSDALRFGIAP